MQAGLDAVPGATLLMIPTAVDVLPDGHEAGDAYALELGGASLKLLHAALGPRRHAVAACETEEAAVPAHLKVGPVVSDGEGGGKKKRANPHPFFVFAQPTHSTGRAL